MNVLRLRAGATRGIGLRTKLALVVTSLLAVICIVISVYVPSRAREARLVALEGETLAVAKLTAFSVGPALLFEDESSARELLDGARESTGVAFLVVERPNGTELARSGPVEAAGHIVLEVPVEHVGERIGGVRVGSSLAPLAAEISRMRLTIWSLALGLFLVASAVIVILGAYLTRPLREMVATAHEITAGRWDRRAPVSSRDEAGELAIAMNLMLDRLAGSRRDLESLNENLEQRVATRTLELEQEVAERVRGQAALEKANERFALAAAAVEGAIYDVDIASGTCLWTDGLTRVFGHAGGAACSSMDWWLSQIHDEDRASVGEQFTSDVAAGRDHASEYRFHHLDGRYRNVVDRGRAIRDADGRVTRMVGIMVDVTPIRQLEEQYLHAQRMEAVGRLAGGIAHDFNNILTTILGYEEIIRGRLSANDPARPDLVEIRRSGERAAALTQQLLAFSRKQATRPSELDLTDLVENLQRMLQRMLGEDVALRCESGGTALWVRADRAQVEQMIVNIAVNARDAMPGGGTLRISSSERRLDEEFARTHLGARPGSYALIELRDDGFGMSPETLARLFEPFFTTKAVGEGTGLGMSIVYGIVEQHQGYVWVESAPDQGTTVRIALPLIAAPAKRKELRAESRPLERASSAKRILVIEDENSLRKMIVRMLRGRGYEVLEAPDGEAAVTLAAATEGPIDLVVSDVIMPVLGGREAVRRLRETRPDLRVIFMSGYTGDRVPIDGDLEPGCEFLAKPFQLAELLRRLRVAFDAGTAAKDPAGDPALTVS